MMSPVINSQTENKWVIIIIIVKKWKYIKCFNSLYFNINHHIILSFFINTIKKESVII